MATSTLALDLIADSLMGVRTRQEAPVAVPQSPLQPYSQCIVPFTYGDVFISTGANMEPIDTISIYSGGYSYSVEIDANGKATYITQYYDDMVEDEGKWEMMPIEVWGWPVVQEGSRLRSLAGVLPDTVAEGLYAIGILVE